MNSTESSALGSPGPASVTPGGTSTSERFTAGRVIAGRYRFVARLGRGAMGEVYRVDDLRLGVPVALKVLPAELRHLASLRDRLLDEVRISRSITHPNVCRVYDVSYDDELAFLTMELIDGEDLASLLSRIGRLPRAKALEIGRELCLGLAAAHQQGVLHRDLKPANIMIDGRGRALIADFGVAALTSTLAAESPGLCGTPAYMAPELFAKQPSTVQSDLYALGLVLYELLTGELLITGTSLVEVIRQHKSLEPPRLSEKIPGIEPAIEQAIQRCLEKDPAARCQSADEVARELARVGDLGWRPAPGQIMPQRPHWCLERALGSGGFGEVWLSRHVKTGENRVFKFCFDRDHLERLQREITLFRLLKEELGEREDIARVLDWSFEEPPWFVELEATEGGDLKLWVEKQGGLAAIPLSVRLSIVSQVAHALAAAHSVGVVHKDVKPSNVLITLGADGRPRCRLTDFGIGVVTEAERFDSTEITVLGFDLEDDGALAGSPLYTAPEVLGGRRATVQADIYALGVMLYQLVVADFTRALAPGWESDVEDELLRADIAAAVDGSPSRRLGNALRLAERLEALEERRRQLRQTRGEKEAAEKNRRDLERLRRRRVAAGLVMVVLVLFAIAMAFQERRASRIAELAERAATRAKDAARVAVAGQWLNRDPTTAALLLREVADAEETVLAAPMMRQVAQRTISEQIFGVEGEWLTAGFWTRDERHVLTVSRAGVLRAWRLGSKDDARVGALDLGGKSLFAAELDPGASFLAVMALALPRSSPEGDLVDASLQVVPVRAQDEKIWGDAIMLVHEALISGMSWNEKGDRLAAFGGDGAWAWSPGRHGVVHLTDQKSRAAAWHPEGRLLALASGDGTVEIWNLEKLSEPIPRPTFFKKAASISGLAWSPDGRRLVAAGDDGSILVWRYPQGTVKSLSGTSRAERIDWSPDSKVFVTSSRLSSAAFLWSIDHARPIVLDDHDSDVFDIAWSPGSRRLATASTDGTVRLWRIDGTVDRTLLGHRGPVVHVAWDRRGERLLSASYDGRIRLWNLADPLSGHSLGGGHGGWVYRAVWNPAGTLIATGGNDQVVRVFPSAGGRHVELRGHEAAIFGLAWSPDGRRLAASARDGAMLVWTAAQPVAWRFPSVRLLRASPSTVQAVAFSPGGSVLAGASYDGRVWLWHLENLDQPTALEGHSRSVYSIAWSPDGRRLASGSVDGMIRIWSVDPATLGAPTASLVVLRGHDNAIPDLAWSPDGEKLASVSVDGSLRIWPRLSEPVLDAQSIEAGAVVIRDHEDATLGVAWSPDGNRLANASFDGTANIWPASSWRGEPGARPMVLLGTGPLTGVAWSPDGTRLVTASRNREVTVWSLDLEDHELQGLLRAATRECLDPEFRATRLGETRSEAEAAWRSCQLEAGPHEPPS